MLCEFFLTPEAFCDSGERLKELRTCLFPFGNTPVALVCQIGSANWIAATANKIARIRDGTHRNLAKDLFQKVCDEISVVRPLDGSLPPDENAWIDAAKRSRRSLGLDGIVVSDNTPTCSADCTMSADFVSAEFWKDYSNPRIVERNTSSQEAVLRSFCTFSHWIIVRMPQLKGGNDDEIVTVKQIVRLATALPHGYRKSDIEIQFPLLGEKSADHQMNSVVRELREFSVRDAELRVTMFPEKSFVNRELLGGEFTSVSSGERRKRARWLMTMSHVAVGGRRERNRDDANSWNLYSRRDANERLSQVNTLTPVRSQTI
jgi:hypothetical protein